MRKILDYKKFKDQLDTDNLSLELASEKGFKKIQINYKGEYEVCFLSKSEKEYCLKTRSLKQAVEAFNKINKKDPAYANYI